MEREMREERDITNWMNEIFAASKLYDLRYSDGTKHREHILKIINVVRDCKDGLVLLCFLDLLAPDIVDWNKANHREENGTALSRAECLVNCHYAISIMKQDPFWRSFHRIEAIPNDGLEIYNGNRTLILLIARNLINFHYLKTLTQIMDRNDMLTEQDILQWTNHQLKTAKMLPRFCRYFVVRKWRADMTWHGMLT